MRNGAGGGFLGRAGRAGSLRAHKRMSFATARAGLPSPARAMREVMLLQLLGVGPALACGNRGRSSRRACQGQGRGPRCGRRLGRVHPTGSPTCPPRPHRSRRRRARSASWRPDWPALAITAKPSVRCGVTVGVCGAAVGKIQRNDGRSWRFASVFGDQGNGLDPAVHLPRRVGPALMRFPGEAGQQCAALVEISRYPSPCCTR